MKRTKKSLAVMFGLLALLVASAYAVFADPGSEQDPLVSKSYVDAQIAAVKSSNGSFAVVQMKAGQKIVGQEGTEIIVRSGEATAIDNGENGISDLTDGKDLRTGQTAPLNHLLLVPREDGRGILAGTDGYLMIRGGYTVK